LIAIETYSLYKILRIKSIRFRTYTGCWLANALLNKIPAQPSPFYKHVFAKEKPSLFRCTCNLQRGSYVVFVVDSFPPWSSRPQFAEKCLKIQIEVGRLTVNELVIALLCPMQKSGIQLIFFIRCTYSFVFYRQTSTVPLSIPGFKPLWYSFATSGAIACQYYKYISFKGDIIFSSKPYLCNALYPIWK
jgi:hypothetical protein